MHQIKASKYAIRRIFSGVSFTSQQTVLKEIP
jgi:hypothetical protein